VRSKPLDANRIASFIELHPRNSECASSFLSRPAAEEIEFAIRSANGRRIQDAFNSIGLPVPAPISIPRRRSLNSLILYSSESRIRHLKYPRLFAVIQTPR